MGATSTSGLPNWGRPVTGILVGLFKGEVLLRLCWPVSTLPGLLKVGNMSVGDKFKVTNPVYISHMIILTTADSSSLAYWLPSLLNAQCELHYFALVFLQLILECHFRKFSARSSRWCGSLRQERRLRNRNDRGYKARKTTLLTHTMIARIKTFKRFGIPRALNVPGYTPAAKRRYPRLAIP